MPKPLRALLDFYRTQLHLLWRWSGGWGAVARRAAVIFATAVAAFALTTWLVPGISVASPIAGALAAIVLATVSTVTRPVLVALLSAVSALLVGVATLALQAAALLAVARITGAIAIDGATSAAIGSVLYAVTHTVLTAGLSVANDDSFFGTLVRQLAARHRIAHIDEPGCVFIQIDGLAYPLLLRMLESGAMPTLAGWLASNDAAVDRWEAVLPTQTSASQAGILHGNNDGIPAFRWWEKERQHLYVSNHPVDAREIQRRVSDGRGLLAGGASIGNLLSGDAERAYLTAATLRDARRELRRSHVLDWFFISPYAYLRWIVLSIGEIVKEVVQARRERRANVEPRGERAFPYPLARAATNVILRHLVAALVVEEIRRGTATIYADFVDYDEIAHHSGTDRVEARDALRGIDRIVAIIEKATLDAPREYRIVVLSDHGQSPGASFRQRYGERLEDVVKELAGGDVAMETSTGHVEHAGRVGSLTAEATSAGGALSRAIASRGAEKGGDETPEVVVAASGNLGQISFPRIAGRASLEAIDERYPRLVGGLVAHPGIGLVLVRSDARGAVAIGRDGTTRLGDGRAEGADPVAPYGPRALDGLRRVDAMPNCADLVLVSTFDPITGEVAAFEEQIGSHGGLGGWQSDAFVLHPASWRVDGPIVGATKLHEQLRSWLATPSSSRPTGAQGRPESGSRPATRDSRDTRPGRPS